MNNCITLGIDIGGSHITSAAVDLQSGNIIPASLVRGKVNSQGSLDEILNTWTKVIKQSSASVTKGNHIKLGMAMPGPFDYEDGVSLMVGQNKYDALYGLNVKHLLSEKLSISPDQILMMNDASCFLKGEVYGGIARNHKKSIGLTLGTGLGTAKYDSFFTYDAELWCLPFLDSIVEDYISTRWLVKRFKEITGVMVKDVKEITLYTSEKVAISQVFTEFGINLGNFLVEFIRMENPQVVVLGGNIAKAFHLFIDPVKLTLNQKDINVPVLQSTLGENAAIIGAASLWANNQD